jgi:hypothetical protein
LNTQLAPTYQYMFGDFWVFWFSSSNRYSVVDSSLKVLLDTYLNSNSTEKFKSSLLTRKLSDDPEVIQQQLEAYLTTCNTPEETQELSSDVAIDVSKRHILKTYALGDKHFRIYYDSELVLKTIHPAMAHLETKDQLDRAVVFDLYLHNDQFHLFKNRQLIKRVAKREYHLIQGKFVMELICELHDKTEDDWVGTFHGSAISDGKSAILFVGNSGSGKSTLCTLLMANGYELLADDVSPLLAADNELYRNPLAVSIKEGAFELLEAEFDAFKDLPETLFNRQKGRLKYLPGKAPHKSHYPCRSIVKVNYQSGSSTLLEEISIKTILETFIPDSWLSSDSKHAKQFLEWLGQQQLYQLTYSDTTSAIKILSNVFESAESH